MNCEIIDIFRTFSWNRHHSHTGARFWEGFYTKKVRKKRDLFVLFRNAVFRDFASSFLIIFLWLFTTHRFTSIKLRFSKVQSLFSCRLRCLKNGKMAPADAFWSSRVGVVYIFEEELNGFLTVYFTWYFVSKILHFRNPWFCFSKTKVCEA